MAYRAVQEGAAGVDMGRNIFQSDCPTGMIQAVGKIVHEGARPAEAFEVYLAAKRALSELSEAEPREPQHTGG